ncbi:hypothetical protein HMPREF0663_10400 [Hoylesella oralis ATCC 33269]|uniref:Uncharacterized protein n=1 Tax=Hoylesella oralis ATCC 33269 TaxID=873533 RepID=E7RMQ0_9BACT|nr:hypothetical protein HMPREF0663_10400 [Hoylesella oralis ATCC 33269]
MQFAGTLVLFLSVNNKRYLFFGALKYRHSKFLTLAVYGLYSVFISHIERHFSVLHLLANGFWPV